jgi:hypothetical protein
MKSDRVATRFARPALPWAWTAANSNCKSCNLSAACCDRSPSPSEALRPPFRFSQLHLERLPVSKPVLKFVIQAKTPTVQRLGCVCPKQNVNPRPTSLGTAFGTCTVER